MTILTLQIQVSDNMFSVCYSHKPRGINQILRILGRSSFVLQTRSFTRGGLKVSDLEGCLNRIKVFTFFRCRFFLLSEWIYICYSRRNSPTQKVRVLSTHLLQCVFQSLFFTGDHFFSALGGMRHFVSHTSHVSFLGGQCGENGLPHFGGSVAKMGCHTFGKIHYFSVQGHCLFSE